MAKKKDDDLKIVADNRKARHLYFIESTLEAGIMLMEDLGPGPSLADSLLAGQFGQAA